MTAARWYAVLAASSAAFIAYGSFVPFHFQHRPLDEAWDTFAWVMQTRWRIESRSDLLANVLLGVPLGFGLLGAWRVDRPGRGQAVRTGLALWPGCVALAAAVEFAQLYIPGRYSSATDVIAQGVGAAVGMAAWVLAGQRLTDSARRVCADPRAGGPAGRLLMAYLGLVALAQLLPLDLSASPYAARRRFLRGDVTLSPFAEWAAPEAERDKLILTWLGQAVLFLPAGLLLARLPARVWRRWSGFPAAVAVGCAVGLTTEAAQLLVSRYPSVTDVLVGAAGLTAGWVIGVGAGARQRAIPGPRVVTAHAAGNRV
ncbi:MAG TPA: VanZ family protein [Fimbriiglobus sp.]|nr:VanZ family protein [Fimbriiglobus sp.]